MQAVVTIRGKGLYQFEGQYRVSKEWFKLDSGFLKQLFQQVIQNSIIIFKNIKDQDTEVYTKFIVPFDEECMKTKYE